MSEKRFFDVFKFVEVLPLEEGKTYETKFQTRDKFTITQINKDKDGKITSIKGIYENRPHLGECPLNVDRIVPETKIREKNEVENSITGQVMEDHFSTVLHFIKIVNGIYKEDEKSVIREHINKLLQ